jgi:hypothetical protein
MASGECPKCARTIDRVVFEEINAEQRPRGNAWIALSVLCPSCRAVLGVQIDPIALKADVLAEVSAVSRQVNSLADGIAAILVLLDRARKP